ncbi:MAG TPA: hypothetical protein VFT59_00705, partial [Candidatus Saccharimonadales bacterium]|nr:hypothetical protein [Candidatus Saccharimonadales bacterium]
NIVASSLSEGIHSITVIAEDLAGNTQMITREYTVDRTIPQITTGIENNQVVKGIITVSMIIDEPRLQTSSITLLDGDNKVIPLEQIMVGVEDELAVTATDISTLRWDTRKVVDGTYTLQLYGKDTAGNEATLVRTIVVDNVTPPLGMGVVGTNDSPSVDPLLDKLSKQLAQPFPSPRAFAVAPTTFANVTETVDEEMLTLSNTPSVPETDQGAAPIAVAPTEGGWRILGILWYWWLLVIGTLAVVIFKWRPIWQATTLVLRK